MHLMQTAVNNTMHVMHMPARQNASAMESVC
jgi:hypothetical protein